MNKDAFISGYMQKQAVFTLGKGIGPSPTAAGIPTLSSAVDPTKKPLQTVGALKPSPQTGKPKVGGKIADAGIRNMKSPAPIPSPFH